MPAFFKSLLLLLLVTIGLACPPRAALAQKAVLYEENPAGQHGKRFVGTVIWRSETVSPGLGQQPEHVISADIEVPERDLAATWLLHRNNDRNLSATHVVEITFKLPAGDPHGGVSAVAGLLMRQSESVRGVPSTRGVPFVALAVKVTDALFLVGFSNADLAKPRNLELLKENGWFDIPIVYGDNRRAILAIEKGAVGMRMFDEILAEWAQDQPAKSPSAPTDPPKGQARMLVGSGFVLTTAGHVLTNSHVVQGCTAIRLRTPAKTAMPARLIARDEANDLVVLKTDARVGAAAVLRNSPSPRMGEAIVVFGFPLPGLLASSGNATIGIITALAGLRDDVRMFQISASVQPGNSGGPVLDMSGNVIGVVASRLNASWVSRLAEHLPQNINFAIKSSTLKNFLDARGVAYSSGPPGKELSIPDIVERAKAFSVEVRCEK